MNSPIPSAGLVIPTLNAGDRFKACLDGILRQSLRPNRLLVIDSQSLDKTASMSRAAGFETVEIARSEFNHGGTRQWAAEYLSDCEIVIFLTQDAVLSSTRDLDEIVGCFEGSKVAVAYGRQLPHEGATAIEAHARLFNYGSSAIRKDSAAAAYLGTKVFFCSNSFAAYRRSVLLELGGFRCDLILGEDMEFAARAIRAGYVNLYCAAAAAYHSHDYSLGQLVARYFDIGVFDTNNSWMREQFGSHAGEGVRFVASEMRYLAKRAPQQIPRAMMQIAGKLLGYRLGRLERRLPKFVKRKISMQPGYWR